MNHEEIAKKIEFILETTAGNKWKESIIGLVLAAEKRARREVAEEAKRSLIDTDEYKDIDIDEFAMFFDKIIFTNTIPADGCNNGVSASESAQVSSTEKGCHHITANSDDMDIAGSFDNMNDLIKSLDANSEKGK